MTTPTTLCPTCQSGTGHNPGCKARPVQGYASTTDARHRLEELHEVLATDAAEEAGYVRGYEAGRVAGLRDAADALFAIETDDFHHMHPRDTVRWLRDRADRIEGGS